MELHYLAYLAAALPSNEMESMSREDILAALDPAPRRPSSLPSGFPNVPDWLR